MDVSDQSDVIAFLSSAEAYGLAGEKVERLETHGAVVFLIADQAYKMKRAVYFEYMDFSTLERRRRCCEAEVAINGRTAPDIYLDTVAVTREDDGRMMLNGDGIIVEWLVRMKRFPQEAILDKMALAGELGPEHIEAIARMVHEFFSQAEPHPDPADCDSINDIVEETARLLPEGVPDFFSLEETRRLGDLQREQCRTYHNLMEARRRDGFVRLGHGDLHLRNLCLYEGRPVLFDAIEFNDRLAIADILYDLAFLVMDLLHRGLRRLASQLVNRYLEFSGDYEGVQLLPLYISVRAGIRAFTAIPAAAGQTNAEAAARIRAGAAEYLQLAISVLETREPALVAIGGLSGSGKSTLAKEIAPCLRGPVGAIILRSDVLRKQVHGVPLYEKLPPTAYTREVTEEIYQRQRLFAESLLNSGQSVVLDAVHSRPEERKAAAAIARQAGLKFVGLWLEADPEQMAERIENRRRDPSDATRKVLELQKTYRLGELSWKKVDNSGSIEDSMRTIYPLLMEKFPITIPV